jgi:hypothetical protein
LRLTRIKLDGGQPDAIIINTIGPDLSPQLDSTESEVWAKAWKKSILKLIASEFGSRIGVAFNDDAISLVEEAEANGFKKRSILSAVFDRLSSGVVDMKRQRIGIADPEALLKRYLEGGNRIWVLVDDVDQNFEATKKHQAKIAGFFTACRQIIASIPEVRFRLCTRPNVWAIVKREFESLSHIEQYVLDLSWTEENFRSLLAQRVTAYLHRTHQLSALMPSLPREPFLKEQALVDLIFENPMPWGGVGRSRPVQVVLHTYARHRPRWMIEMCKLAAAHAVSRRGSKINFDDLQSKMEDFGRRRVEDTIAEFKSQCENIEEILAAFSNQPALYTTDELIRCIRNSVLQAVRPKITGVLGVASEMEIAHFLFQIGFLTGRRQVGTEHYDHVSFAEQPSLLRARTNIDDGLRWEIHPVFRNALNLRTQRSRSNRHG